ncbi:protein STRICTOSIDINE SYNTHASE-LIKE 10-like [Macadamia integrifolia]|uniref:protein STRICTOSIDINE SYNTHASE-LIKE 10-like n=1 Tax=Macadamia integrifolia TaxID=60698 RepID=UPI001C4F9AE3|nr:protein STRICTOSIDINE SYNTHASE-LIKE 10-like [Macadamia integrifolia]
MRTIFLLAATILALLSTYLSRNPISLSPPPLPGAHDKLKDAEVISLSGIGAFGAESIVFDRNGEGPYIGVADGRILKWQGEDKGWMEFAVTSANRNECVKAFAPKMEHVCGRPLGLQFHYKTGDLYIADAYFGLLKVGPNGGLATPVVTEAEGKLFKFTNNIDIDEEEGVVYFTHSSTKFDRREFVSIVLSQDTSGRFLKYDIASKEVTVLMRDLLFPNGVALSKDRSFVLVVETGNGNVQKYWLQGPKAGTHELIAELPGFPDNLRRNSDGDFWVALYSKKGKMEKWLESNPSVMNFLSKYPYAVEKVQTLMSGLKAHAIAMKLNEEGQVVEVFEDSEGKTLSSITEVEENNGYLWIAAPMMPIMGRIKLH